MIQVIIVLAFFLLIAIAAIIFIKKLKTPSPTTIYNSEIMKEIEEKNIIIEKEIKEMPTKTAVNKLKNWFGLFAIILLSACIKTEFIIIPSMPTKPSMNFEYDEKSDRAYLKKGDEKKLLEYLEKWDLYRLELVKMFTELNTKK